MRFCNRLSLSSSLFTIRFASAKHLLADVRGLPTIGGQGLLESLCASATKVGLQEDTLLLGAAFAKARCSWKYDGNQASTNGHRFLLCEAARCAATRRFPSHCSSLQVSLCSGWLLTIGTIIILQELVSHDTKNNTYDYKHTFCVDIVPICRDNVVILPKKVAQSLGNMSQIVVCMRVSNVITLIDPSNLQMADVNA